MDHLLSSVLLAASSNVDNLGIAVAYGVKRQAIRLPANVLVSVVSGAGTLLSMLAGEWVNDFMSEQFAYFI